MASRRTPGRWKPTKTHVSNRGNGSRSRKSPHTKPCTATDRTGLVALTAQSICRHRPLREALVKVAGTLTSEQLTQAHVARICGELSLAVTNLNYRRACQWELKKFLTRTGAAQEVFKGFPRLRAARPREVTVPEAELERVWAAASNRLRLALVLARDAALRRSAIEAFNIRNCDFDRREVVGMSKAWSTYRVPMTNRLWSMLTAIAARTGDSTAPFIALLDNHRRAVKACTLLWELRRVQKSIGLAMPAWGLHDLRRTAARDLYTRTGDIRKVQRLLGHVSPICTWHYIGQVGLPLSAEELEQTA